MNKIKEQHYNSNFIDNEDEYWDEIYCGEDGYDYDYTQQQTTRYSVMDMVDYMRDVDKE